MIHLYKLFLHSLVWLFINLAFLTVTALGYVSRLSGHKVTSSLGMAELFDDAILFGAAESVFGLWVISWVLAAVTISLANIRIVLTSSRAQKISLSYLYVLTCIMLLNCIFVPESSWNMPAFVFYVLLGVVVLASAIYSFSLIRMTFIIRENCSLFFYHRKFFVGGLLSGILAAGIGLTLLISAESDAHQKREASDVIIIGLDSIRPNLIHGNSQVMSWTSSFLNEMVVFPNSYTPLARTYPSWASMMSGLYPHENGAYFNLVPFDSLKIVPDLPGRMKQNGYFSIYAANERRFSNFDERFGFDTVVGPKTGLLDFVIGTISDTPFINLARSLPLSRHALPFIRSNRAAHVGYRSDEFTDDLISEIGEVSEDVPLFLAAHLCEAHWPYVENAKLDPRLVEYADRDSKFIDYLNSVVALDATLEGLIHRLKEAGRLENALLLVVSDHGESFSDEGFLFDRTESDRVLKVSGWGHGTSVANLLQSKVLISMQVFENGSPQLRPSKDERLASLIDVYPTVLDALNIRYGGGSGASLLAQNTLVEESRKTLRMETGFSVPAISERSPDMAKAFEQGFSAYQLEDNGYVAMKDSKITQLINNKEVAVFDGSKMLMIGKYSGDNEQVYALDFDSLEATSVYDSEDLGSLSASWVEMGQELCVGFSRYDHVRTSEFCSGVEWLSQK